MPLSPGVRFGAYEVVSPIGAGGMGEVYRARDTRLGRDVALKILPDAFAGDPERLARFEREAKTLAALNHPNIAQIYGVEESGGVRALVLEFVAGPTLADRIADGPVPAEAATAIARQIALALEAAHDLGIVHRDLKPSNIKVREDDTVKVLDFGLAKALDPNDGASAASERMSAPTMTSPAMTGVGIILGTAAYMSPEQARGRPVDQRADIWAFGCVLYEMLSGRRAFDGEDVSTTLAAVLKEVPDSTALPTSLPASVRRLLRRCLEKDPRNRLSSIRDARLDLDEPDDVRLDAPSARSKRAVAPLLGAAVAGAIVAATAAWLLWPGARPASTGVTRVSLFAPDAIGLFPDSAEVTISPDGRWVAMATAGDDKTPRQLWVRAVNELTPRRIAGTDGASLPFWSPDSRRIAFFDGKELKTVPVEGGRVNVVCPVAQFRGGTWNAADVIVFSGSNSGPLHRVSARGGETTPVTTLDGSNNEAGHRFPSFLPDGDHFLFVIMPARDQKYEIGVGSLTSGTREIIGAFESAPVYAPSGHLLYMRRGALVGQPFDAATRRLSGEAVPLDDAPALVGVEWTGGPPASVSTTGVLAYLTRPDFSTRLVWVDRAGKETSSLNVPSARYVDVKISPDGKHAAVVREERPTETTIWLIDLVRGGGLVPVTTVRANNFRLVWASDSTRLFFASDREGPVQIYMKRVDDNTPETPAYRSAVLFKYPTSVHQDSLVFELLSPESAMDLWTVSLSGSNPVPAKLVGGPEDDTGGLVSPDGRWLAFRSESGGPADVWIQPFPGPGRPVRVTTRGSGLGNWSSDSRRLLVFPPDGASVADVIDGDAIRPGAFNRILEQLSVASIETGDTSGDFGQTLFAFREGRPGRLSITLATGWAEPLTKR